jgi:pimeloyl-ACP methyl ester carboxylesterase
MGIYIDGLNRKAQKKKRNSMTILKLLTRKSVQTRQQHPLKYYVCGEENENVLVLVNAFGVSLEFWKKIIANFVSRYKIITWEYRGSTPDGKKRALTLDDHVDDLQIILTTEKVTRANFVCWCSGAKLILLFLKLYQPLFASLSIIAGSYGRIEGAEELRSDWDNNMSQLTSMIVKNPAASRVMIGIMKYILSNGDLNQDVDKQNPQSSSFVNKITGYINPRTKSLVIEQFLNQESITNHAHFVEDFKRYNISTILPAVNIPTLIIGAENDRISHPQISRIVAGQIANSIYINLERASHWCLLEDADKVIENLECFLGNYTVINNDFQRPARIPPSI